MRTPFLLTTLAILLEGCAVAPPQVQPSADQFIDEKLAQSASAISLAQRQLQQTAPARPASVSTPPAPKVLTAPVAVPVKAAVPGSANPQLQARAASVAATAPAPATAPTVPQSAKEPSSGVRPVTVVPSKTFPASPAAAVPVVVASTASAKPSVPVVIPKPVWEARIGESLRKAITRWCERAHYTLDWQAEDLDYPIQAPLQFTGSFEDAVIGIFHLYDRAERSFRVDGRIAQSRLIVSENTTSAKGATP